jgi:hypothetical protein
MKKCELGFGVVVAFGAAAAGCSGKGPSDTGAGGSGSASSSSQVSTGSAQGSTGAQTTSAASTGTSTGTSTPPASSTGSGGGAWTAQCNPVTNAGCKTGEACDASENNTFVCFPPPNDSGVCVTCDNKAGPFCKGGYGCSASNGCAKYCCDDGDCGTGKCVKEGQDGPLWGGIGAGVCLDDMGKAACDAPDVAPSAGSCVTVN